MPVTNKNYYFSSLFLVQLPKRYASLDNLLDSIKDSIDILHHVSGYTLVPENSPFFDVPVRIMQKNKRRRSSGGGSDERAEYPKRYKYNIIHNYSQFKRVGNDPTERIKQAPIDKHAISTFRNKARDKIIKEYKDRLEKMLLSMHEKNSFKSKKEYETFTKLVKFVIKNDKSPNIFFILQTEYTISDDQTPASDIFPDIKQLVKKFDDKVTELATVYMNDYYATSKIQNTPLNVEYHAYIDTNVKKMLISEIEEIIESKNIKNSDPEGYTSLKWAISNMPRIVNDSLFPKEKEKYSSLILKLRDRYKNSYKTLIGRGTSKLSSEIYQNFRHDFVRIELGTMKRRLQEIDNSLPIKMQVVSNRKPNLILNDFATKLIQQEQDTGKELSMEKWNSLVNEKIRGVTTSQLQSRFKMIKY
jgi:hypothetical protein